MVIATSMVASNRLVAFLISEENIKRHPTNTERHPTWEIVEKLPRVSTGTRQA